MQTGPWWQRPLPNDVVDRIMQGLQKRDPAKAKQLSELRQKDPEKFEGQLRAQGQPELDQIIRERLDARRQERNTKFVEWLKANYPSEEQALTKLKGGDPQLYIGTFDRLIQGVWVHLRGRRLLPGAGDSFEGGFRAQEEGQRSAQANPQREVGCEEADVGDGVAGHRCQAVRPDRTAQRDRLRAAPQEARRAAEAGPRRARTRSPSGGTRRSSRRTSGSESSP